MPPSYAVTSLQGCVTSLSRERQRSLQSLDAQAADIELWLKQQVEAYCNQIRSSPCPPEQPPAKKQKLSCSNPEDEAYVMGLRVKDLQKELKARGLESQGLKQDLRDRLIQALVDEKKTDNPHMPPPKTIDLTEDDPPTLPMETDDTEIHVVNDPVSDEHAFAAGIVPPNKQPQSDLFERKPVKRSRSPLKRVQDGVQSAMKMLSKNSRSPVKLSAEIDCEVKNVEIPATMVEAEEVADAKLSANHAAATNAAASYILDCEKQKLTARLITTPAVLAQSLSTGASTGGLKSNNVKAKNEARMAKLAEIRGKSKPATAGKLMTEPKAFTSTLSSLKAKTEVKDGKRNELAAKIRAKATNLRKLQEPVSAEPQTALRATELAKNDNMTPGDMEGNAPSSIHASPKVSSAASFRSPILSPMDTYDMSDHEEEVESDEDSDYERRSQKRVPSWAHRELLKPALERQFLGALDPDDIFGEVETCNLVAIFDKTKIKARYRKRTSSGNWGQDRATGFEKMAYKRTMQYATRA